MADVVERVRAGCPGRCTVTGAQFDAVVALFDRVAPGGLLLHCGPELRLARPFVLRASEFFSLCELPGVRSVDHYVASAGLGGGVCYVVTAVAFGRAATPSEGL